ncbi:uncharacterized protein LOC108101476 [Drosophila ficusphila]|uniref:uncharacterized protein LOC108101476 n=1 Tax=Drosophila ficusphila TaxID=30025 RepID=UPI0007E62784|nr:uncharacterized protein LOC108101476 [Drosophila ficusphila]
MLQLLTWLLLFVSANAAVDKSCDHRPDVTSLRNCCKLPPLNFTSFNSKCGQYLLNGVHISPCSFECIFRAAGAINGTRLVMPNIEKMMHTILETDEFFQVYVDGFKSCAAEEQSMIKALKRRRVPITGKCSSMALMYGLCSHRYFYRNCPEHVWSNTPGCNTAREYNIRCDA